MTPPSGAQYRISSGDQDAVVVEVGGGLRTYTAGGVEVVEGYGVDEMASGGRGQQLLPWPNRIDAGRYSFAGRDLQLPLTEPSTGNAIHGLARWVNWTAVAHEPDRVVMELVLHPQPGYPFTLGLSVAYDLGPDGLMVATTATNLGEQPCPYGAGSHPYLTVGTTTVDDAVFQLRAGTRLETDERGIPVGRAPVEGSADDFRHARPIGDLVLDTAYTDLTGDHAVLVNPGGPRRVTLWWDESYRWLMVFTGDTLAPSRRRRGLALEPMTCPPNAFATGEDVQVLEPGGTWTTRWGIRVHSGS